MYDNVQNAAAHADNMESVRRVVGLSISPGPRPKGTLAFWIAFNSSPLASLRGTFLKGLRCREKNYEKQDIYDINASLRGARSSVRT
jgi:hypothetical protein